jgi:hypothetical protein
VVNRASSFLKREASVCLCLERTSIRADLFLPEAVAIVLTADSPGLDAYHVSIANQYLLITFSRKNSSGVKSIDVFGRFSK